MNKKRKNHFITSVITSIKARLKSKNIAKNNLKTQLNFLLSSFILSILFISSAYALTPVLQRGYDTGVTGATLSETLLNTTNVSPSTFGQIFKLPVDDAIFAQPLYVPNVLINNIAHNVLYVATMNDTLYAFDADTLGAPLWKVNLASLVGASSVPIGNFVFSGDQGIIGNLGVLSTPVIDLSTNTLFAVACDLEGVTPSTPNGVMVYRLHAIDIKTGLSRPNSGIPISGNYGGLTFDARYLLQRPSLVLSGDQVVFGFGAMELESANTYSGWMMAYNKNTLVQTGIFATIATANGGGGIWQSGRPPVVDSSGYVYSFTGNGFSSGYDGLNNFSETLLKLDPAQGLRLVDWFTPSNWEFLDLADLDLTGSGPMLIPGTHLMTGGGKGGDLFLLDTANLGKFNQTDSQVLQKMIFPSEIRGGPVFWQRSAINGGSMLYHWGVGDSLKAFAFNGSTLATTPSSVGAYTDQIYPGGILTLSANGEVSGSGIVWATNAVSGNAEDNPPVPGVLRAFNASNVAQELWNSNINPTQDGFGNFAKFVPPLVVNGKVYVSTWSNQVVVYGLLSGTTPDFKVSTLPTVRGILPSQSTSVAVNVSALNGFNSVVDFSLSGVPSGVTATLTPSSVSGSGSSTLNIAATPTAPPGSYTLTVTGKSGTISHSATILLNILSGVAPAIDKTAFTDNPIASSTLSTQGITTTAANELLLAFIGTDYLTGSNTTVTNMSGGGLTWTLVQRGNVQKGTSEIWRAFAPLPLTNVTVTATLSQPVVSSMYLASFKNVDSTGAGSNAIGATATANNSSGAPSASLVTTRAHSLVLGVGNDYDNAINRVSGTGQTIKHQYLTPGGDTFWMQQLSAAVQNKDATVTLNDTAPTTDRYNFSLVEVRSPLGATFSISGGLGTSTLAVGSTLTLSGAATATVTADASGNFNFTNLAKGTYVITPSKLGVSFSPASQTLTINSGNVSGVSFTPSAAITKAISGSLTPASLSAGSVIYLSGTSNASILVDALGNYSFAKRTNGTYVVTPIKAGITFTPASQTVTINGNNIAAVNFTAATAVTGIEIDAKAPKSIITPSNTFTSRTFSTTSANQLVLALISADYTSGENTTVTSVTGAGLSWTLVARANAQPGTAEIWRAFAPSVLLNQAIRVNLSQSANATITVLSFKGTDTTGVNGANAIGATATQSSIFSAPAGFLTTTRNGSLVVGVGNDNDNAILRKPGLEQTIISQYLSPNGHTFWVQKRAGTTPAVGSKVTINDTSPNTDRYNLAVTEIRTP